MLAKVRKRHHICQVNELVKEKLEHKAAKSTAINGCPVSFLFPVIVCGMIQGLYQVFRQRLAMSLADIFLDI